MSLDIMACWKKVAPLMERRLETSRYQALASYLNAPSIQAGSPCIMLYGVYNAGKSTLVNALLGRDAATVGDVPTTDSVQRHEGGGYTLLDTPGIDAPVEHENISREQLRIVDMVLWVMFSDTSAHEDRAYHEILNLQAQGKRVLIVVNTDEIDLEDYSQRQACVNEIYARLQCIAAQRGVTSEALAELPVCWINAQSAYRARIAHKPTLLAKSGYLQFVDTLHHFLAKADALTHQRAQAGALKTGIEEVLSNFQASNDDTSTYLHTMQRRLDGAREQLIGSLSRTIREQRLSLENVYQAQMRVALERGKSGIEGVEDELSLQLSHAEHDLEQALARELAKVSADLEQALRANSDLNIASTVSIALASVMPTMAVDGNDASLEGEPLIKARLAEMSGLANHIERDHITVLLSGVKKVLPQLMKGIGPVKMGRMADKLLKGAKVGGPVLITGIELAHSLYQQHQAQQQAAEQRAAIERFRQQVQEGSRELGQHYQQTANSVVTEAIHIALQPLEQEIQQQLSVCQVDTSEFNTLRQMHQQLFSWLVNSMNAEPVKR